LTEIAKPCPHCGYLIDAHTVVKNEVSVTPKPGDYSICLKCTGFMKYDQDMNMLPKRTIEVMKEDEVVFKTLVRVREIILAKNAK